MSAVNHIGSDLVNDLIKTADTAMQDTCILYRPDIQEAQYGSYTGTPVPYGTVACLAKRAALVTPEFRTHVDQEMPDTNWMILLPRGTDVQDHDVITFNNPYGGATVSVVDRLPRTIEIVRRVFCRNTHDQFPS